MRKWYATNCSSAINAAATPEAAKRDEKQDSLKRNALFENPRVFCCRITATTVVENLGKYLAKEIMILC
jgi:hypothetical protein